MLGYMTGIRRCVVNPWISGYPILGPKHWGTKSFLLGGLSMIHLGLFPMGNPVEVDTPKRGHVCFFLGFLKSSNVAEGTFHDARPRAEFGRNGIGTISTVSTLLNGDPIGATN